MKMRFKKYASVFLCLALILGVFMPMSNAGLVKAETTNKEAAITNLIDAWGKMQKIETIMYPTIQKVSGTNTVADNLYATSNGLDASLPTGIDANKLGDYYAYHTKIFDTTGTGNNRIMWSKSTTAFQMLAAKIDKYDDIAISFYIEDLTVNASGGAIQVFDNASSAYSEKSFVITEAMKGKWTTLNSADMVNGGIDGIRSALASRSFGWIQFNFGDNKVKPKGWFGSLIGVINADVPELDGAELVAAAKALDISGYENTEAFTAALSVAEELYAEEMVEANLKAAWSKMYIADTLMSPTIEKISGTNTESSVYNTADGIESLPAGITADDLGDYYAYHTGVYGTTGTGENRFMWSKNPSGSGVVSAGTDISVYDDLSVSFYVEEVATEGSFSIDLYTQGNTVDVANTTYNITAADEGKWVTFRGDDMRVNGFDELISKMAEVNNGSYSLYFFQFGLGSNATKFKGYFGSLLGIKNAEVPELDGAALVKAAMDINVADYTNTDEFVAALNVAKELYSKEIAIENLKSAWSEMYIADTLMSPTIEKISGDNTQSTVYNTADGIEGLPAGITADDLGDYYAYHTGVYGTTGTDENRFMWSKNPSGSGVVSAGTDISVYDDLSVSFYVEEVATEGSFSVDLYTQGNTVDVANTTYNITAADEGKWITFRGDDMRVNGFDELISKMAEVNNGSYRLYFFQFGLGSNATKFKGYFGSLLGIKNAVVPDLDGAALIVAANQFNASEYKNADAFIEARAEAAELYATELAVLNANEEIKIAYNKMYSALDSGLKPAGAKVNNAGAAHIGADNIFTTAESEVLPFGATSEMLGDYYAFHDINDNTAEQDLGTNSYDRILFCGRADRFDFGDGIDISEYDGFYINVYYKAVNQDGKIYTFLTGGGTAKQKSGNTLEVTADDAGKWITYTDEDIISGGIDTIRTSFGDGVVFSTLMMCIEGGLDIEAYVGSMVFHKNIEETTLDTASDTFISEMRNVDLTNLYNKEQFINTIIDNTNELAEKYADNEEIISKIKFADDCNAYGGVDLKDLVRLARYIDDSETVKIDNLAADSNGDKAINTNDESLLRAKLLQQ